MHHKYILTGQNRVVDIGRAQFLMDREVAAETAKWVEDNWTQIHDQGGSKCRDQAFWDHYCERHLEKHGAFFEPDVNPLWE